MGWEKEELSVNDKLIYASKNYLFLWIYARKNPFNYVAFVKKYYQENIETPDLILRLLKGYKNSIRFKNIFLTKNEIGRMDKRRLSTILPKLWYYWMEEKFWSTSCKSKSSNTIS